MGRRFSSRYLALIAVSIAGIAHVHADAPATAPYAGQKDRSIKALSDRDIDDLLAGRGWGFAMPAELNGYPGPAHLLELKSEVGLSKEQEARIRALFSDMRERAVALGQALVEAERSLDRAFAAGTVDEASLSRLARESGRIRAELRIVHLETHLKTLPVLTHEQVMTYNRLRGYGRGGHSGHKKHGH